jgi:putative peptide zinc metalloprotease protein
MSATADPPVAVAAAEATTQPALARVDGLDLLGVVSGSGYKDGAALVRRADGQMVQLGPLMYALLEEIDGRRDNAALSAAMTERLGRRLDEEHVDRLGEKLADQGLLAGSEDNAPPRLNPLLALRWKVLVTDPAVTRRITAPFRHLFRPWILLPVLAGFAIVAWFVLIHKGVASATAQAFGSPELLLLVLGLGIASAGFHEIGHASACRYGGGRPGGMGAGIYIVWPAFYTDVTDAYRLPRRARLRTDLGGLYFNAVIAVVTLAVWLAVRADALLLLIALQMLEMVKQLSPVIRSDGYHILSDATGVPDLYAHIGPTLRRLLPWERRQPSALTGRARVLVTGWVLVIVPVLISMSLSAILLLPKLAASTWESGSHIASSIPDQAGGGQILPLLASIVRLFALALPVLGTVLMAQRLVRTYVTKARTWSADHPARRAGVVAATAALLGLMAWAWWPSGQYQPVRASDDGTLLSVGQLVSAPATPTVVRPELGVTTASASATPVSVAPGRHMAVALIPVGGATKAHPAIFVIKGKPGEKSAVIVTDDPPKTTSTPTFEPSGGSAAAAAVPTPTATPAPAGDAPAPVPATAFPFILPKKPGPNDSQALATNSTDGGIKYDVVYSLVTVKGGDTVDETNSAYALASCKACMTVAVSFQLVLIVGQSNTITPINVAEALNVNCPSCITTAIASQIVVTLKALPSDELLQRLTDELKKLDAISALGANGTPANVAKSVQQVQDEIDQELSDSGLLTNPPKATATATPQASSTPGSSATPDPSATPDASATPTPTPTPSATATPTATASPSPTATDTPSTPDATPTP